ncbi:PmoA family protein [Actinomadura sp. ATCC 31491]|uniref:PmoA family protein n=1 Tax=Actinomadura luzonensis TaxID=2805427 RepID=A0ABT0G7X3_9ACTN|nr:PmoA family protein [Actinomadura luzonensis]MCK2220335.1 PmoA family protein [Actinomadura luzonensis]
MPEPKLAVRDAGDSLIVTAGDVEIAHYVHRPGAPAAEAPKPFLHPLRTLSGAPLSVHRPWDHRWHKGLQMTWAHLSGQNFWGGPTYSAGRGYQWEDNLGRMEHDGFTEVSADGDRVVIEESLRWITAQDEHWITERRRLAFHSADAGRGLWALDFATELRNVRGAPLDLGSPTTHGRPLAGYAGWFWRGPRSWTGAAILAAGGRGGEEMMGEQAPWLAMTGQHDDLDGGGTVLAFAGRSSAAVPIKWFVRSSAFAAIAPSPAFDEEIALASGDALELAHRHVFVDRVCERAELEELGAEFAL